MEEKQIVLKDGSMFSYIKRPAEITNPLGVVIAILKEYIVTKNAEKSSDFFCKLYKTKEGNWYDKNEEEIPENKMLLQQLKSAIDELEKAAPKTDVFVDMFD